jgi:hypothetical protein
VTHALFVAALIAAGSLPEAPFDLALFVLVALLHGRGGLLLRLALLDHARTLSQLDQLVRVQARLG